MALYDLATAKGKVNQYAQSKGYGPLDDNQFSQLGAKLGVSGQNSFDDSVLNRAYGEVDSFFGGQQAPPPAAAPPPTAAPPPAAPPPAAPAPTGAVPPQPAGGQTFAGIDPSQSLSGTDALAQLTQALGRPLTPAETAEAMGIIGYTDQTGAAPVTGAQLNQLLQTAAGRIPGSTFTPFAAPQADPTSGGTADTGDTNIPPNLRDLLQDLFAPREQSATEQAAQSALQALMERSQETPSLTDPNIGPVADIFRSRMQRAGERGRASAAERASANGTLNTGGFDTTAQGIEQDARFQAANFEANLLSGEMDKRRQELQQGIQLALATGNQAAARDLQQKLALLQASLGESQFGRDLDLRGDALDQQGELGQGQLALQLLGLLTGNQQFYDQLGTNSAFNLANLDQRTLQAILGGL